MIRSPVGSCVSVCQDVRMSRPTDGSRSSLLPHDGHTLDDGCAGIVDAIKHRLSSLSTTGVLLE